MPARSALRLEPCKANIRIGSIPISRGCLATSAAPRARRWRAARRSICASTRSIAEREEVLPKLAHLERRADAVVAARAAHPDVRRCQKPGDPRRAGVSQGHDRNPGRRLAACRDLCRRQAGRAGDRSCRRRRRQDAGARGGDGKSRPDLRHRHRQAPAGADPRAPRAGRRAQHPGPHPARRKRRADRSCGPRRSGADRRALHRHRHLAAQSRRQVAHPPGRACRTGEAAGRAARPRRGADQAEGPYRLHHLLGARRGERRPGAGFCRAKPGFFRGKTRRSGDRCWASAPIFLPARRLSPTKVC